MGIVPKAVSTFAAYEAEFGIREKIRHLVEPGERGELVPNKPSLALFKSLGFEDDTKRSNKMLNGDEYRQLRKKANSDL